MKPLLFFSHNVNHPLRRLSCRQLAQLYRLPTLLLPAIIQLLLLSFWCPHLSPDFLPSNLHQRRLGRPPQQIKSAGTTWIKPALAWWRPLGFSSIVIFHSAVPFLLQRQDLLPQCGWSHSRCSVWVHWEQTTDILVPFSSRVGRGGVGRGGGGGLHFTLYFCLMWLISSSVLFSDSQTDSCWSWMNKS